MLLTFVLLGPAEANLVQTSFDLSFTQRDRPGKEDLQMTLLCQIQQSILLQGILNHV